MPETSDLLEKSELIFLYNFHREHSWLKSIIKKLSPKINVKNIKNQVECNILTYPPFSITGTDVNGNIFLLFFIEKINFAVMLLSIESIKLFLLGSLQYHFILVYPLK